jgi:hypothetical protein
VPTREDAERLVTRLGVLQYVDDPDWPGEPWFKMNVGDRTHLEIDDLGEVIGKVEAAWEQMRRKAEHGQG